MTITNFLKRGGDPAPLGHLRLIDDWDSFFQDFWLPAKADRAGGNWVPAVDVEETAEAYHFKAELPGMKKDEVKVTVLDQVLTLSGEKKTVRREGAKSHRTELAYGAFQRGYSLPSPIQADKVEASFKEGVLEIKVPKAEEAKPKEVEVKLS